MTKRLKYSKTKPDPRVLKCSSALLSRVIALYRLKGCPDENGRSLEVCGDARQLSVGKLADECGVDVQLNANGPVKYTEWYK